MLSVPPIQAKAWGYIPNVFAYVKRNVPFLTPLEQQSEAILREIGEQIKAAREKAGISKNQLSSLAGIDRSTIRYAESPGDNPTILTLIKIGIALKLDIGSLISESVQIVRKRGK